MTTCRHEVKIAIAVCFAEVLFQPSFFWCCLTRCMWKTRHPTRWLWFGFKTEHAAYHGTWHCTDWTHTPKTRWHFISRIIQGKRVFARHPCIEPVSFLVVSASGARSIRCSFWVLTSHKKKKNFTDRQRRKRKNPTDKERKREKPCWQREETKRKIFWPREETKKTFWQRESEKQPIEREREKN